MRKRFHHCFLFLILLQCSLAYDFFRHVNFKPFDITAVADSDAPVISAISATSCSIKVNWICNDTCHENLNEIFVYWQQTGSEESNNASVSRLNDAYEIKNLNTDQSYTVWVASVKDDGQHNSDSVENSTNPGDPHKVMGVEAKVESDSIITVSWKATSNPCPIKGYYITWSGNSLWDESLNLEGDHNVSEDTTSFEVGYLTPYTDYTFYVREITTDNKISELSDPSSDITKQRAAGPPESVTSRNLSFSSVNVSWTPPIEKNGEISGYHISCQLLPDPENLCVNIPEIIDDYSYEVTGLKGCGEYTFSVYAVNGGGNGVEGTSESTTNPDEDPPNFLSFSIESQTSTSVNITWDPPDTLCLVTYLLNVEGEVLWDESRIIDPIEDKFNDDDGDSLYTINGLIPWSSYKVTMSARTEGGIAKPAPQNFVTDESAAGPPTIVNIAANGSHSVLLNWTAPEEQNGDISHYRITCKNELLSLDQCRGITASDVFSYMAEGLDACGKYTFRVHAVNGFGDGEDDMRKSTTDPDDPTPITNVDVVYNGSTSIIITIDGADTACDVIYDIKGVGKTLWDGKTFPYTHTLDEDEKNNTYVLDDLTPYSSYKLSITAATDSGKTDAYEFSANTIEDVPSEPTHFKATSMGPNKIYLTWGEPEYLNGKKLKSYSLSYALFGEGDQNIRIGKNATSYTLGKKLREVLLPCRKYKISLRAKNDAGLGNAAPDTATLDPNVPRKLKSLTCTAKGSKEIDLKWEVHRSTCKIQNYELSFDGNIKWGTKTSGFMNITPSDKSYSLTNLIPNTDYTIDLQPATTAGAGRKITCHSETDLELPDPPRDLTVKDKSKSEITIQWKAPEMRNGVLTQFIITYNGKQVSAEAYADTNYVYSKTLEDLDDDVIYSIDVYAENAKGVGNPAYFYPDTDKNHLGVILGTVIPLIVIIIAAVGGVWYMRQSKKKKKKITQEH